MNSSNLNFAVKTQQNPAGPRSSGGTRSSVVVDFPSLIEHDSELLPGASAWVGDLKVTGLAGGAGKNFLGLIKGAGDGVKVLHIGASTPKGRGGYVELTPKAMCRSADFEVYVVDSITSVTFYRGGEQLVSYALQVPVDDPYAFYRPVKFEDDAGFSHIVIHSLNWGWIRQATFETLA